VVQFVFFPLHPRFPWYPNKFRDRSINIYLISRAANMRLLSRSLALAALLAGAVLPNVSQSQVVPAIRGGGSQINVYGFYSLVNPDAGATLNYPKGTKFPSGFANTNDWNNGGGVGADFRLGRFIFGQPAVGARFTWTTSTWGTEKTYLFGPELHYVYGKFRPYGSFLLGVGDVTYKPNGVTDNSIVYQIGGGVDYRMGRRLSVRMVDFQYQFWNLGTHNYTAGLLPGQPAQSFATTLRPFSLNFGVLFRVF
jgi:Outer membrane protein beta-barrel domain